MNKILCMLSNVDISIRNQRPNIHQSKWFGYCIRGVLLPSSGQHINTHFPSIAGFQCHAKHFITQSFGIPYRWHYLFAKYFPSQIFQIAAHLVYWGKAIIIYPLCENNVYMLSPHANICLWVSMMWCEATWLYTLLTSAVDCDPWWGRGMKNPPTIRLESTSSCHYFILYMSHIMSVNTAPVKLPQNVL